MAQQYGLTDQGFINKPFSVIRQEINTGFRLAFGNSIDVSDRSVLGIIAGIFSERLSLLWELLETITSSQDPSKATGALLAAIASITGTLRPGAAKSTVTLTLTGDDVLVIAAGSRAQTLGNAQVFETLADVTLAAPAPWTAFTPYLLAQYVQRLGNIYRNIDPGTSGSSGPSGFSPGADGGCLWRYLGTSAAVADVDAAGITYGPLVGAAFDITTIATPIGGWTTVTNFADALLGRLEASDEELRALREAELANGGSATVDALRANLLNIHTVADVTVFPNNTDVTDVAGVPPHSVEVLIRGGVDQDIFDELLTSLAAGIGTYGLVSGSAIDSEGEAHVVKFSRSDDIEIYTRVNVTVDPLVYPADGDIQIANALVTYGASQSIGRDAVPASAVAQAFSVSGVIDVPQAMMYTEPIKTPVVWLNSHAYFATPLSRDVVTSDGRTYICITSGTSASTGILAGSGTDIIDSGAHWRYLGANVVIGTRQLATFSFGDTVITSVAGVR